MRRETEKARLGSTRLRPVAAVLVVIAMARIAPGVGEQGWIRLPDPDLSALEQAVADQLREYREIATREVANPEAGPEDLAASIGELGRYYHAYELVAPAESCYTIARRLTPQDFRWHYYIGYLHQGAGRLEEAEEGYLRALEVYRAAPPALLRLAEVYIELDRQQAAASLMREALALDPTSAAAQAALGELYQALGRNREAIELLEAALEAVPAASRLYYPLAIAFRSLGETEKARDLLARSGTVGIKPVDPLIDSLDELRAGERAFLLTGQTAFRAGRYEEAVEKFRHAVEAEPESVSSRINLGAALAEAGDGESALLEFEQALKLEPENPTALYNAGVLRGRAGDVDIALGHLGTAARLEPDDPTIRQALAEIHVLRREPEEAIRHYRAAAELAPPGESARLGGAQVLALMGRFSEARDVLDEGLRLDPSSGQMAHALSRLLAMAPDLAVRDGERALELAQKVYAARRMPRYASVVAAALAEQGRCAEAADWQARAVDSDDDAGARRDSEKLLALYRQGPPCRYPVE